MVLFRATTTALPDFNGHGAGHHISGREVLGRWRIPFHEPLALAIDEESSLSSTALRNEATRTVNTW